MMCVTHDGLARGLCRLWRWQVLIVLFDLAVPCKNSLKLDNFEPLLQKSQLQFWLSAPAELCTFLLCINHMPIVHKQHAICCAQGMATTCMQVQGTGSTGWTGASRPIILVWVCRQPPRTRLPGP